MAVHFLYKLFCLVVVTSNLLLRVDLLVKLFGNHFDRVFFDNGLGAYSPSWRFFARRVQTAIFDKK